MAESFYAAVRAVVGLLVAGRYDELESRTGGKRLTAADVSGAVKAYGRTLIDPPAEAFDDLDTVRITDAVPPAWSVRVDLWTAEEGRSDLSMELTVTQGSGGYEIELDDLHVL